MTTRNFDALFAPASIALIGASARPGSVGAARSQKPAKPVLCAWLGEVSVAEGRHRLNAAGRPAYATAEAAVRAFARLGDVRRLHAQLLDAPDGSEGAGDVARARDIVGDALEAGQSALDPLQVQGVLQAYGIPILESRIAHTPEEAGAAAGALGGAVALKILCPEISHKSDVGGVQLGLKGCARTARAARAMISRVQAARPEAQLEGFLVQPMLCRPKAQEVLAGMVRDPTFGPVVMVGHGGVAVEVLADRALALPPLNIALARDAIARTRVSRLLGGYRDRPPADLDALGRILVTLGRLASDIPEITEVDLNPILCDAEGALAVDARIAVSQVTKRLEPAPAATG